MLFSCCFLQSGDKAYVLCFVEFENAKCARGPMKELQGSNSTSFGLWFVHVFILHILVVEWRHILYLHNIV